MQQWYLSRVFFYLSSLATLCQEMSFCLSCGEIDVKMWELMGTVTVKKRGGSFLSKLLTPQIFLMTLCSKLLSGTLVYYCKWCNPIGNATRYLFINRYQVMRQVHVFHEKTMLIIFLVL